MAEEIMRDFPGSQRQTISPSRIQAVDPFSLGAPFPEATTQPIGGAQPIPGAQPGMDSLSAISGPQRDIDVAGGMSTGTPFRRSTAARVPMRTPGMSGQGFRFGSTAAEHNQNARLIALLTQGMRGGVPGGGSGGMRSTDPRGTQPEMGNANQTIEALMNLQLPARRTSVPGSQQARGTPMGSTATASPMVNTPSVFDVFSGGGGVALPGQARSPFFNAFRGRF